MIGQPLGSNYRIERMEGSEGPVQLYTARVEGSDTAVSIWLLDHDAGVRLKDALITTARMVQSLRNERILEVLEAGEDSGIAYVAVEKPEGAGLDHVVKGRSSMSIADSVGLAYQALRALESVWSAGMVHGRIEPRRLIVESDGLLKLAGLELAGLWLETPFSAPYTAPEVRQGQAPDVRSDMFSLGVILFELLSGRLPFPEDGDDGTRPASLRYLRPDAPRALEALLERAMDPDPDRRPQSGEDMTMALEAAIQDKPYELASAVDVIPETPSGESGEAASEVQSQTAEGAETPAGSMSRRRLALVTIAAIVLAAIGAGAWLGMLGGAEYLGLASPAPVAAPVAARPTVLPTDVPPTAVPPTVVPAPTQAPGVRVLKTAELRDTVGREYWVSEWSDGTTTKVEIVPAPVLQSLDAKVRAIRMFETGPDGVPLEKRKYDTRFSREDTRFMNYELDIAYPDPGRTVNFFIRAFYYDSADRLIVVQTQNAHVEAGWTQSYHWNGYGWQDPGHWEVGKYRVDLYDGTAKLGSANFEIYAQGTAERRTGNGTSEAPAAPAKAPSSSSPSR